ncbi:MAG TPA: YicC family protein [Flavobacteriales bacterium]|nr:YicC family protein [Flavobacteriales bacterium]
MILSMTGFGRSTVKAGSISYTAEIKSVNSKNLDLSIRVPGNFKLREAEIRGLLASGLVRGKIDFNLSTTAVSSNNEAYLNKSAIKAYLKEIKTLSVDLKLQTPPDLLSVLLKMPNSMQVENVGLNQADWRKLLKCIKLSISRLTDFRINEGKALKKDLLKRMSSLEGSLKRVERKEKSRSVRISKKLQKKIADLKPPLAVDQNRFEQEMIYYLEKIDITEERVRLKAHCEYFRKSMKSINSNGKKLGFIAQEMGREINTIGAKANDVSLQQIVVEMKDDLEKIKEQLFNVL